jgi:hypothetical protein
MLKCTGIKNADIILPMEQLTKYSGKEKTMEEILISFGNYGFPMVVSAYLLVRVEQKIDALSVSIKSLAGAIEPRNAL